MGMLASADCICDSRTTFKDKEEGSEYSSHWMGYMSIGWQVNLGQKLTLPKFCHYSPPVNLGIQDWKFKWIQKLVSLNSLVETILIVTADHQFDRSEFPPKFSRSVRSRGPTPLNYKYVKLPEVSNIQKIVQHVFLVSLLHWPYIHCVYADMADEHLIWGNHWYSGSTIQRIGMKQQLIDPNANFNLISLRRILYALPYRSNM